MAEQISEEVGCAVIILAIAIGIVLVLWAVQGFPGLR